MESQKRHRAGDLVDKYRIERVLGEGAMGYVVEATHLILEEKVAIKFLLDATNSHVVARFVREARATRMLKSEHVVKVFDVGSTPEGTPFIVMELLDGRDLDACVGARPLPVPYVVELLLQACEALAEAHGMGIVHRDLKPANLFVTSTGAGGAFLKVLDFGISKITAPGGASLTRTTGFMGTALYVSPEQLRSARDVDARADVWALGVILFELLTGTHPFLAEDIATLSVKIVTEPPTPLRSVRPELPEGLERLILRCLEKEPAARFRDVAELSTALSAFASLEGQGRAARIARTLQPEPFAAMTATASGTSLEAPAAKPPRPRPTGRAVLASCTAAAAAIGIVVAATARSTLPRANEERAPERWKAVALAESVLAPVAPVAKVVAAPNAPSASITAVNASPTTPPATSGAPTPKAKAPKAIAAPKSNPPLKTDDIEI
jgi:eukaryotic-like serine/threonine-protein kinase